MNNEKTSLGSKISSTLKNYLAYWKTPPKGYYMPFKEVFSYAVGGIGAYFIFTMAQALLLSTTNVVIGNTIGIAPTHMLVLYWIATIFNIPMTAIRASIIDNAKHKQGKYRPYILRMGIPTAIISLLFVYTPYDKLMAGVGDGTYTRGYFVCCALVLVYNFGLQFFYNFFYESYENLIHVLSPNTQERANTASIKAVVYSLAPSITQAVTPLIAKKVSDGNIYSLSVYRWMYPFIAVGGVLLSILVYANTKEKIVQAKTHVPQIRFIDALRAVAKNKYFWIISLAGWIGFLEGAQGSIMGWLYNYGKLCTSAQYSLITLVYGNASLWGMLAAPFAIKKWGKKNVLVVTNLFNILFIALLYPSKESIWMVLICMWMNALMGSFAHILNPTIQADIRDYQHYRTGERIDGMFGAVGLIGSFITMLTSTVLPAVYEKFGIHAGNGHDNMWDILYDEATRNNLIGALIMLSIVGAALNVIPYFFYDLSEVKQRAMVKILKIRALFEDYGNDALSDRDLVDAVDMINEAKLKSAGQILSKAQIQEKARKAENPRKEKKQLVQENGEIYIAQAVMEELYKFHDEYTKRAVVRAKAIYASGLEGLVNVDKSILTEAKQLPCDTREAKRFRKESIENAKLRLRSKALIAKHYPDGIVPFDFKELDELYEKEKELDNAQFSLNGELVKAQASKDSERVAKIKAELKATGNERYILAGAIKDANRRNTMYHACAKPYIDAHRLIVQEEAYDNFESIVALYDDAKRRAEEKEALEAAEAARKKG